MGELDGSGGGATEVAPSTVAAGRPGADSEQVRTPPAWAVLSPGGRRGRGSHADKSAGEPLPVAGKCAQAHLPATGLSPSSQGDEGTKPI